MKYTLDQSDTVTALGGATLYRIQYADGTRGGYLQSTANLDPDGDARVRGNAQVYGDARVHGNAQVYGDARVRGNARVHGDAWVYGNAQVWGNARVHGNAQVYGDAWVRGNARVSAPEHCLAIGPLGSRNATLTVCRDSKLGVSYVTGCFFGSRDAFIAAIGATHGNTHHGNAYAAAIMLADHVVPAFGSED